MVPVDYPDSFWSTAIRSALLIALSAVLKGVATTMVIARRPSIISHSLLVVLPPTID